MKNYSLLFSLLLKISVIGLKWKTNNYTGGIYEKTCYTNFYLRCVN